MWARSFSRNKVRGTVVTFILRDYCNGICAPVSHIHTTDVNPDLDADPDPTYPYHDPEK
jgi:hypothetical protein